MIRRESWPAFHIRSGMVRAPVLCYALKPIGAKIQPREGHPSAVRAGFKSTSSYISRILASG
jgi:hypothetical protein